MPTYNYSCDKCDNTFEEQLPIAQRKVPEGRCVECNDGDVRQMIVAPGFAYDNIKTRHSTNNKEPGWYSDKIKDMKRNIPGNKL
jgi:putative FmdB family regulatory protein|tara:strand:- start:306 stop:557 length:252 start_codon:yes stop_codon:yes gene_type:complete